MKWTCYKNKASAPKLFSIRNLLWERLIRRELFANCIFIFFLGIFRRKKGFTVSFIELRSDWWMAGTCWGGPLQICRGDVQENYHHSNYQHQNVLSVKCPCILSLNHFLLVCLMPVCVTDESLCTPLRDYAFIIYRLAQSVWFCYAYFGAQYSLGIEWTARCARSKGGRACCKWHSFMPRSLPHGLTEMSVIPRKPPCVAPKIHNREIGIFGNSRRRCT